MDNQNNDKKIAVALKYEHGEEAPQVIASGIGTVAGRIIVKAKENDIPTYEDSSLAKTLLKLDIGEMIPPELYSVVAEILVYVDKMDKLRQKI